MAILKFLFDNYNILDLISVDCLYSWKWITFFLFTHVLPNFGSFSLDIVNILLWRFRILLYCCENVDGFCLMSWDSKCKFYQGLVGCTPASAQNILVCCKHERVRSARDLGRVYKRSLGYLSFYFLEIPSHPLAVLVAPDSFLLCLWSERQQLFIRCAAPLLLFLWPKPHVSVLSIICLLSLTLQCSRRGFSVHLFCVLCFIWILRWLFPEG